MVIGKSLTLKYDFAWQESDPAGQLLGYRLQSVPFCRFCNAKQLFVYEQVAKRIANIRLT